MLSLPDEMTRCGVCVGDLCSEIFQCQNGLHHYCQSCVDKSPFKQGRVMGASDFEFDVDLEVVWTLETSSPTSSNRNAPLRIKKRKLPSGTGPQSSSFYCAFCASNSTYTRTKWLENLFAPSITTCSNVGCNEQLFQQKLAEHLETCRFRPFSCPLCSTAIPSFEGSSIQRHFEDHHHLAFIDIVPKETITLPDLTKDKGYYFFTRYPSTNRDLKITHRLIFVVFSLHSEQENGDRIVSISGIDMTERTFGQVQHVFSLHFEVIPEVLEVNEKSRTNNSFILSFESYSDNVTLKPMYIALLKDHALMARHPPQSARFS